MGAVLTELLPEAESFRCYLIKADRLVTCRHASESNSMLDVQIRRESASSQGEICARSYKNNSVHQWRNSRGLDRAHRRDARPGRGSDQAVGLERQTDARPDPSGGSLPSFGAGTGQLVRRAARGAQIFRSTVQAVPPAAQAVASGTGQWNDHSLCSSLKRKFRTNSAPGSAFCTSSCQPCACEIS